MKLVYLIHNPDNGLTKIGYSKCPQRRLKNIQWGNNMRGLRLVNSWQSPDAFTTEQELHKRFAKRLVSGEWFNLTQEDIDTIHEILDKYTSDPNGVGSDRSKRVGYVFRADTVKKLQWLGELKQPMYEGRSATWLVEYAISELYHRLIENEKEPA